MGACGGRVDEYDFALKLRSVAAMLKFRVEDRQRKAEFNVVFRPEEHSIDAVPAPGKGITSVLVNDMNLELDQRGRVLYAWGYCPIVNASSTSMRPRRSKVGSLVAFLRGDVVPGISERLNPSERWPIFVNEEAGWICLGEPEDLVGALWVEFAPATVAMIVRQRLRALWVRPTNLPRL